MKSSKADLPDFEPKKKPEIKPIPKEVKIEKEFSHDIKLDKLILV